MRGQGYGHWALDDNPEALLGLDAILDDISVYRLTGLRPRPPGSTGKASPPRPRR
ncbi:hypothetical protein [Fodinicola feengrottensis]|uniref:Uncharacterized protein n=1 Tax=Fodinicola feengrottensis TaxID=435914 RepID=A0ABN2IEG3_9ACTN|nr:hypothetical protein [Fodinicola feengrottensis]